MGQLPCFVNYLPATSSYLPAIERCQVELHGHVCRARAFQSKDRRQTD